MRTLHSVLPVELSATADPLCVCARHRWTPLSLDAAADAATAAPVLPHSDSRSLDGLSVFSTFVAVAGREDGFTQLWVVPLIGADAPTGGEVQSPSETVCRASDDAHRLEFESQSFTARMSTNSTLWQTERCA